MKVIVENLEYHARIAEVMASFGKPMTNSSKKFLMEEGFDYVRVVGCLKWIWSQWLLNGDKTIVRERVAAVVDDGIEHQGLSPIFYHRPRHDLLLLNCAIFASSKSQLLKLAESVVDGGGFRNYKPRNNGELYESAWCGIFKYWILGDLKEAARQAELVWGSWRPPWLKAGAKPVTLPWIKQDWKVFVKAQKKDFERLWANGRRNGTVRKEAEDEITVTINMSVEQLWCWAHCGMALLAHRQGVEVATDAFWFPPHALDCVPK